MLVPRIPIQNLLSWMIVWTATTTSFPMTTQGSQSGWQARTVLVSKQGDNTVVQSFAPRRKLLISADPQVAIEWALAHAANTLLLAGHYLINDRIDIPRPGVTLIIEQEAKIELNATTSHTSIGFGSNRKPGYWQIVPLIYNEGHHDVEIILFGTLTHSLWDKKTSGKQTFPLIFDGRNEEKKCGITGGRIVILGSSQQSFWIVDSKAVDVPLVALDTGLDAALVLEGSEDCRLGMITNLARIKNGETGETVDLNSRNRGIHIERLIGERSFEIIDCNESHASVDTIVSIGVPRKLTGGEAQSGPRFTSRQSHLTRSLEVRNTLILGDATGAKLTPTIPPLLKSLPRFSVNAIVDVDLTKGQSARFQKTVEIKLR